MKHEIKQLKECTAVKPNEQNEAINTLMKGFVKNDEYIQLINQKMEQIKSRQVQKNGVKP